METKQDYEIRKTIELIREYIRIAIVLKEQQTDIADKFPFERMIEELSMAIFNLESQYGKNKKEESVKLTIAIWSPSYIEKLHTNYLPGSTCYVLQDNSLYILDTNHEWVKA